MSILIQDSIETFTHLDILKPGQRYVFRCRHGGIMRIMPFGPDNSYAHVFFHEHEEGGAIDSTLLLPETVSGLAAEGMPLNHLEPASTLGSRAGGETTVEDVRKAVKEATAQDPKEALPDEKNPEGVQSPVEAGIFNQLRSKELLETTLANVFGDNGVKIQPGSLVDSTFLDAEKTLPVREIVYFITREGRPILQSFFDIFYDSNKQPSMIITRALESIKSRFFRKVIVEQTQKSSSFSAGLTLGLSSPTNAVSSGPAPGDVVHSQGQPLIGPTGTTFGFNASFTKTFNRLRIEAELEVEDELGTFINTVTRVPPAGG